MLSRGHLPGGGFSGIYTVAAAVTDIDTPSDSIYHLTAHACTSSFYPVTRTSFSPKNCLFVVRSLKDAKK